MQLSSNESRASSSRGNDCGWSSDELPDLDDDFNVVDEGEAYDLGLAKQTALKKRKSLVQSYELTQRFQTIWSAI